MAGNYNSWLVLLSIVVAIFVSYTALNLSSRVARSASKPSARFWLAGGAVSMGCGIWSMHFVGMLAFSLPIALSYDIPTTVASLAIAIGLSGFALSIASREQIGLGRLAAGAIVMGLGICAMHYSGMSAVQVLPAITYEPSLLLASGIIAIVASFAALWLFFRLRNGRSWQMRLARLGAAVIMGLAISGMHYTGMAASRFAPGSYCTGAASPDNNWLAITIAVIAFAILTITTILLIYDAHLDSRIRKHNRQLAQANEQLEEVNAQLQHVAMHDALSGLPNRLLLADRLSQAIAQAERHQNRFAVFVVDLDRFKAINDSLGHLAGDAMLKEVARRLASVLRKADTLARLGGDEFVLVLNEIASAQDVETIAGRVLADIARPVKLSDLELHTSASIGISLFPADGTDAETLLQHADAAMYHAKKNGRNTYQLFVLAMNAFAKDRLELENGLRRALVQGEFVLHYQPKVDVRDGGIDSAEALIRWQHPTRGLTGPLDFIPLAEESGLILPIGEWVLREACRQACAWQTAGLRPLRVAVNLSAQQFRQKNLVAVVRSALNAARLEPRYLELELTESAVMHDAEQSIEILQQLSALGVRISVDDFGTGYSSLSYLRRLPLDKLKIDRAFIRDVVTSRDDAAIVRAIVSLAHNLRLKVIAEGVETPDQLAFLRELGCDQYQGYHYSVPVPDNVFVEMLREHQAKSLTPPASLEDTWIGRVLRRV
ncbi:MAG TPA: EAL domain-containing protein [Steroidobacteraceae bacterium]|nr:EAL domain-containing protein [Steroidobacteraceae bacterium]